MAYGDFKDLPRQTASEKVLRDEAFNVAENSRYDGYQLGLNLINYSFFDFFYNSSGFNDSATRAKKFAGCAV